MSQSRPGPGGGYTFIGPSDLDETTSTIKPAVEIEHARKDAQGDRRFVQGTLNKSQNKAKATKPPKPKFESTLAPWVMAFKPQANSRKGRFNPFFVVAYLKWFIYTRLRLMKYEFISPPSTIVNARAEIRSNIQYLKDHRQETNAIIVVLSAKGGAAKTSIIQWLAAFIGYYVKSKPALLGMDVGADKTVWRFDSKKRPLFSVSLLIELVKQRVSFTANWIQDQTETDEESGVVLFQAKPEGSNIRDFNIDDTANMLRYMHELYPLVFGDNGPGLNMRESDGAAQAAHVALVCNKGISEEALSDIRATLTLPNYDLASKRIKPLVVISGVIPSYLNTKTQYEIVAKECHVDPKNVILLPYDRYLVDERRRNLKHVHISALTLKSTLMLSRLAKRVVEAIVESKPKVTQSAEQAAYALIQQLISEQRTGNAS